MNKILTKVTALCVGLAMVAGVGVAVGSKSVGEAKAGYEATTTVAVGDTIVFANDAAKKELSGVGMIGTNSCGLATDFTGSVPNAAYPLTVEQGSSSGSFAFKTSDNTYLSWSSGNTLTTNSSIAAASSWTVVNVAGKGTMLQNVGTTARHLSYNSGSPRFCAYGNTGQQGINLYKYVEDSGTKYTVSYNNNGGQGTMDDTVATSPVIAACTFTAPEGKKFGSWNTAANGGGTSYNPGDSASTDLTLYAIWVDIPNYTCAQAISAYDNSGEITNVYVSGYVTSIYTTADKFSGGKISYYVADTKDGGNQFEFYLGLGINGAPFTALTDVEVGAFVKGYGSITKYNSTYEFENGNYLISYTAPVATDYSVSFNGNGASGSMSGTSTHGDYTLPANGFDVPNGKVFAGWKAGNAGDLIAAGTTYSVSADVVFYAQWADICTVTYTAGANGSGSYIHSNQPAGSYSLLPFTSLEGISPAEGYHFKNYTVSGTDYAAGTEITISGATSVTVNFEEGQSETTVSTNIGTYASNHSWVNATQYETVEMDSYITVASVGGSNTGKYYTDGNSWRVYQNENPTITFTAAGGSLMSSITITYGIKNTGILLDANSNQISSGTAVNVGGVSSYTFGVGNTGSATNGQVQITSIEVVYFQGSGPIVSTYTVAYDANGGTGTMTDSNSPYNASATVTTLENTFERSGYTFKNWNTAADGTGTDYAEGATFTISANTTLYAVWEENGGGGSSVAKRCYSLVTSEDQLVVGAQYVIVASSSTSTYAMSVTQNSNNRAAETITVSGTVASVSSDAVQAVTLSGAAGAWNLGVSGGYLYASSSSSNQLKTEASPDANGNANWAITFSDGVASIVAQGTNSRKVMQYNIQSTLFACYAAASQTNVSLYRLDFGETLLGNITCDGNGSYTFADGFAWSDLKSVYQSLPSSEQSSLKTASNDGLTRYDYLIAKYGESVFENFIDRSITPLPNAAYILNYQSNLDSSSSITIIVIVAVTSMTLLGVTLVLRKRKHQ